jgi:DNA-binding NarL/FixJ family response regulator
VIRLRNGGTTVANEIPAGSGDLEVLLVEDGDVVREEMRTLLEGLPAVGRVVTASSVEEGHRQLVRAAFDVGVFDFRLGDGTALELLEGRGGHPLPEVTVVVTQHASPRIREACRERGADHYVEKRYARESLSQIIGRNPGSAQGTSSGPVP